MQTAVGCCILLLVVLASIRTIASDFIPRLAVAFVGHCDGYIGGPGGYIVNKGTGVAHLTQVPNSYRHNNFPADEVSNNAKSNVDIYILEEFSCNFTARVVKTRVLILGVVVSMVRLRAVGSPTTHRVLCIEAIGACFLFCDGPHGTR